jgi:hypothetical protein
MHLTGLDFLLWAAGFVAGVALLFVLWFRKRASAFPIFTTYIAANVVRTIVLYALLHFGTKATYFYVYWSLAVIDDLLQLGVIYEISSHIFRPLGGWATDVRSSFVWLISLSFVVAGALTWLADPPARLGIQLVVLKGNFFSAALMSELFVALIALSVTVGLPWKAHVAKICQGLGAYSVVDFLIEAGHNYFGLSQRTQALFGDLAHIRIGVSIACLAYWAVMLWQNAPAPRELSDQMYRELSALQVLAVSRLQSLRSRSG